MSALAPATSVRGNNDKSPWAAALPDTAVLEVDDVVVYVIHDLSRIETGRVMAGVRVIVSGHSHKPSVEEREGVLYVNPGSAGPRRFKLPIAAAELVVSGRSVSARLVDLERASAA